MFLSALVSTLVQQQAEGGDDSGGEDRGSPEVAVRKRRRTTEGGESVATSRVSHASPSDAVDAPARPGAGSGAGAGAGAGSGEPRAGPVRPRKVAVPAAGGYDKLVVTPMDLDANPRGTTGPNLVPADTDQLVTVETAYVGINYADVCVRWGLYESAKKFVGWPITPGFEFSGRVTRVATGVTDMRPGDLVFGTTLFGGYSTHITVPRRQVFALPDHLSLQAAAGLPAVAMTAYYALFEQAKLRKGQAMLVHSAAGGVGTLLCQMGKIAGCRVIGVVGKPHKVKHAAAHGCDHVVDKSSCDLWAVVDKLCPDGFHAVFDANGVSTLADSFARLAQTGRLVVYGFHSMLPRHGGVLGIKEWVKIAWDYIRTPRFMPLDMTATNRAVLGFNLSFLFKETELLDRAMTDISKWMKSGQLKPAPVTVYDFDNIAQAHRDIESGTTVGKLILSTGLAATIDRTGNGAELESASSAGRAAPTRGKARKPRSTKRSRSSATVRS